MAENSISLSSKIWFVFDGSSDNSWDTFQYLATLSKKYVSIRLSRNWRHQNALLAGLEEAAKYCDAAISMDCDDRYSINAINKILPACKEDNNLAYAARADRDTDTGFKRLAAELSYCLMSPMRLETAPSHFEYWLLRNKTPKTLPHFLEISLFLRGLASLVGVAPVFIKAKSAQRAGKNSLLTYKNDYFYSKRFCCPFNTTRLINFIKWVLVCLLSLLSLSACNYKATNTPL